MTERKKARTDLDSEVNSKRPLVNKTEWWQRGPVADVPAMLQPVAHIVLQIGESVHELVAPLTEAEWNARPAGVASIAFHVRHIIGVMDRLFTYARGDALSEVQFTALRAEGAPIVQSDIAPLLAHLDAQIASALAALRAVDPATLGDYRDVGRAKLPSTVIGCLVHGAEHGMRHVGQLSVTARIVVT
jgi:DinB superfamily